MKRAFGRRGPGGLPAGRAFFHALCTKLPDAIELHRGHDRPHVDRLVEWSTDAQPLHAIAQLLEQLIRHAFLHQQTRAGTADLPLIEPDRIDYALHHAIEVGVLEHDERTLAAQFERQALARPRGGHANRAANFGAASERDLVDIRVPDDRGARASIAGDEIEHARWQADLLHQLGEAQRREWRELGGLEHDRVSGGEGRCDFPRQHEQREIPRNHLPYHTVRVLARKLGRKQLRPAGVIREMPRDERNIDVARFANRLAVVDGLEHREVARMLLNAAGDGVQPAGARVIVQRLPTGQRGTGRGNGSVYVVGAALSHAREQCSGRWIVHLEQLTGGRRGKRAADEMSERAAVTGQPGANDRIAFRRRAVAHGVEDLADGAARWCRCGSHAVHTMGWR